MQKILGLVAQVPAGFSGDSPGFSLGLPFEVPPGFHPWSSSEIPPDILS